MGASSAWGRIAWRNYTVDEALAGGRGPGDRSLEQGRKQGPWRRWPEAGGLEEEQRRGAEGEAMGVRGCWTRSGGGGPGPGGAGRRRSEELYARGDRRWIVIWRASEHGI